MRCDICRKEWEVSTLCPVCWNTLLEEHMERQGWRCGVCEEDMVLKTIELEEGMQVLAVICTTCKVVYVPM